MPRRNRKEHEMHDLTPCLWFDTEAEDAATFYTSVFPDSRITSTAQYGEAGPRTAGMVMTVSFEIDGREFLALNGGPNFAFSEAISFQVMCDDQEQVDRFWSQLSEGGEQGPCGWLKDRFGVSWQVVPRVLPQLLQESDSETSQRVMRCMMGMGKLDIAELERAAAAPA
ncbi:MAG TPA: VOC family protein [Gaiellales bacterium]|jgi:predicted 3-demethylubiquinone-9 3-methyltransferase (glyoxalase superfamily)